MLRIIIILFGIMLSSSVLAETVKIASNTNLLIGLSAASTWTYGNRTQTLNLESDVTKTYTANQPTNVIPSFELLIGCEKPIMTSHPIIGQLGLRFAEAGNANLTGDIWEDANPNLNNFNYEYKVRHFDVSVKGRLIGAFGFYVDPYISGSMGVGINRAYDFTITPKISSEVAAPPFASNTQAAFTYTVGIGLQRKFYENFEVAVGYEFADWGKSSLLPASGQVTNQAPSLNHLYAQSLQLSLFFV